MEQLYSQHANDALAQVSKQMHMHQLQCMPVSRAVALRLLTGLRPEQALDSPDRYAGLDVNGTLPCRNLPNVIHSIIGQFLLEHPCEKAFVRYNYQQMHHPLLGRSNVVNLVHEDCVQSIRVAPTLNQPWNKLAARLKDAARNNGDCFIQWFKIAGPDDFVPVLGERRPFGLVPMSKPLYLAQLLDAVDNMCEYDEHDDSPPWFWHNVEQCAALKVAIRLESQQLADWSNNVQQYSSLIGVGNLSQNECGPHSPEHPLLKALGNTLPLFALNDQQRIQLTISSVGSNHHRANIYIWKLGAFKLASAAKMNLEMQHSHQRMHDKCKINGLSFDVPACKRVKFS